LLLDEAATGVCVDPDPGTVMTTVDADWPLEGAMTLVDSAEVGLEVEEVVDELEGLDEELEGLNELEDELLLDELLLDEAVELDELGLLVECQEVVEMRRLRTYSRGAAGRCACRRR
jgi:hypothetical protein